MSFADGIVLMHGIFYTFIVIFAFVLRHDLGVIQFLGVALFQNKMTGGQNISTWWSKNRGGGHLISLHRQSPFLARSYVQGLGKLVSRADHVATLKKC